MLKAINQTKIKANELELNDWIDQCESEKSTNAAEVCDCGTDFSGEDVETDVEQQSGGQSSETVRVLCLPRTTSEILLSKTSVVAGTFCQHKHTLRHRVKQYYTQSIDR